MTFVGLLALVVVLVAGGPVARVREQVVRAPLASGLVAFIPLGRRRPLGPPPRPAPDLGP